MTDIFDLDSSASLDALLDSLIEAEVVKKDKPLSSAALMLKQRKALEELNVDYLLEMQKMMHRSVDLMTLNVFLSPAELSEERLAEIMEELIDQKVIEKFLKTRYEMVREMIFALIDAQNEKDGLLDPTHAAGKVLVKKLGKKFTREGGRLKKVIDDDKLREVLGDNADEVYSTEVVTTTVVKRDDKALMKLLASTPALMEDFRKCVTPAGYTSSSFHQRAIDESDI